MCGHFAVYECTRARFCCRLAVGSPISAFRFPLCVSIVNLKNTTPSGDIPREHYRQHCQYRLRGLRYIARGASQRKNCRHKLYKMRNRRILTAQCVAISRYMSALVHVSAVDSQLEVRFRFSALCLHR